MVISQAQRAEAAVSRMLASVGDRSAVDLRRDLEMSKAIGSKLAAFQARAAAALAALERHGDGGAGVLRHATGMSRRRAESQARTARVLEDMPMVRDALEEGRVSFANAARLAQAAEGTETGAVETDASLLAKAESMPDDQFAREARRWTASHQPDDGEAGYQRRRARRWLRLWDGDDGMTQLRGELDPVTGERIRNRLEAEARRLRSTDAGDSSGGLGDGGGGKRGFAQAMVDALDGLTAIGSGAGGPATGPDTGSRSRGGRSGYRTDGDRDSDCSCSRRKSRVRPIADIAVVAHVDSVTGELVSQLATGEPLPPSVLDLLTCHAALTGVLYDSAGTPLWRGTTKRTATAAQLRALIARDGGCIGCHCHPALCQAHHIRPAAQGGPTTVANMALLCWNCHNRVHHNQWTVRRRDGRLLLEPPIRTRWGPARAP